MLASKGFQTIARYVLETGTEVQVGWGLPPKDRARAAVVYTDVDGRLGDFEQRVAEAIGFRVDLVGRVVPTARLFTDHDVPVLVVRVDASESSARGLGESLGAGLRVLQDAMIISALWLPLFDPDRSRWTLQQTLEEYVASLVRSGAFLESVLLSAPDLESARALLLLFESGVVKLRESSLETPAELVFEPHVKAALNLAAGIASDRAVEGWHVLTSVLAGPRPSESDEAAQAKERPARPSEAWAAFSEMAPAGLALPPTVPERRVFRPDKLSSTLRASLDRTLRVLDERRVWGRHVITAALLAPGTKGMKAWLDASGTDLSNLRDAWWRFLENDSTRDWAAVWKAAGIPRPQDRAVRAGYRPETVDDRDKLGVEEEAEALARLVADEKVKPPLCVGLLGDWGAGKSFFMQLMKTRVDSVKGQPGLCTNIVQIPVNAWQLSDAHLWANLVPLILEEVWAYISPPPTPGQERTAVEKEIMQAQGALHEAMRAVDLAVDGVAAAEEVYRKHLEQLALAKVVQKNQLDMVRHAAAAVGWTAPLDAIVEVHKTLGTVRDSGTRARMVLRSMLTSESLALGVFAAAAVVLFGALVPLLGLEKVEVVARLSELAGPATATLGGVAAALLRSSNLVSKFVDSLERAAKNYDEKLAELRNSSDKAAKARAEAVDRAHGQHERAELARKAAHARLATLQRERAALQPLERLSSFLNERVNSDEYKRHQGIIALVRKDFDALSKLMADWRKHPEKTPNGVRPLDRIILYIDDLDRCSPEQVVQMLEAIHLLLALDLFVVVAAVDSRWLLRSLEVRYRELLESSEDGANGRFRRSTPQNYLEKIFQIPFTVAAMEVEGYERYVDHLLGPVETDDVAVQRSKPSTAPDSGTSPPSEEKPKALPEEEIVQRGTTSLPLRFTTDERTVLKGIHVLIPTPRIAKRVANVFRLIKTWLPEDTRVAFEKKGGDHEAVLVLLALLYGHPHLSATLFTEVLASDGPPALRDASSLCVLIKAMAETDDGDGELTPETCRHVAEDVTRVAPNLTIGDCRRVLATYDLLRYSIVTGRAWFNWKSRILSPASDSVSLSGPTPRAASNTLRN